MTERVPFVDLMPEWDARERLLASGCRNPEFIARQRLSLLGRVMRARDLLSRARRLLGSPALHDPARSALAREIGAYLDTSMGGEIPPPEGSVPHGQGAARDSTSGVAANQSHPGGEPPAADGEGVQSDHGGASGTGAKRPHKRAGRKRQRAGTAGGEG